MSVAVATNTIAPGGVFVKWQARKTRSCRPDVLSKMPLSCNLVFDVLRSMIDQKGQAVSSVRYLAQVTGLGTTTVWRALRRLRGAHLISLAAESSGTRCRTWQLEWQTPLASFPQSSVPLAPIGNKTREKAFSPNGTDSPAFRWAMSRLRQYVGSHFGVSRSRRKEILDGLAAVLWRSMNAGLVAPGRHLGEVVRELIILLRDAHIGSIYRFCGWALKTALHNIQQAKRDLDYSTDLLARIQKERMESRGSVAAFLADVGAPSLRAYIQLISSGNSSCSLAATCGEGGSLPRSISETSDRETPNLLASPAWLR